MPVLPLGSPAHAAAHANPSCTQPVDVRKGSCSHCKSLAASPPPAPPAPLPSEILPTAFSSWLNALARGSASERARAAASPHLPRSLQDRLSKDRALAVQRALAENPVLEDEFALRLFSTSDDEVEINLAQTFPHLLSAEHLRENPYWARSASWEVVEEAGLTHLVLPPHTYDAHPEAPAEVLREHYLGLREARSSLAARLLSHPHMPSDVLDLVVEEFEEYPTPLTISYNELHAVTFSPEQTARVLAVLRAHKDLPCTFLLKNPSLTSEDLLSLWRDPAYASDLLREYSHASALAAHPSASPDLLRELVLSQGPADYKGSPKPTPTTLAALRHPACPPDVVERALSGDVLENHIALASRPLTSDLANRLADTYHKSVVSALAENPSLPSESAARVVHRATRVLTERTLLQTGLLKNPALSPQALATLPTDTVLDPDVRFTLAQRMSSDLATQDVMLTLWDSVASLGELTEMAAALA